MTQEEQQEQQRVSKREFLARVSSRSRIPLRTVTRVYDTVMEELMETMTRGDQLMLTGFGKFYPQAHKGHRVQFAENGTEEIDDYRVLKFSATRSVNRSLGNKPSGVRPEAIDESADPNLFSDVEDYDGDAEFEEETAPKTPKIRKATAPKKPAGSKATVSVAAAATRSARANRSQRAI